LKFNKVFKRQRIDKELENLFFYALTIVSATMGYGKTTSVRDYLDRQEVQKAWVSLLGSDGSEIVFWEKFVEALGSLYPKIEKKLSKLGFPIDAIQITAVINIIKEMVNSKSKSTIIVMDDYHIIEENEQVGRFVELLVQEEIPNLHMVITSRTRPKFNHINLISKGLCYYLDTNTLAFDMQEIKEYFHFMDFNISPEQLEKIYDYTGGWISAIYLMMLGFKQGIPITESSSINTLVRDNLFSRFDEKTKETLLKLSVFEGFTLPQAVEVLQDRKVHEIIDRLVEQNAFMEFDRQASVYKIHNVLLDFLRETLTISGMDMRTIYYRAGKWYIEHGKVIAAFDYYYRSEKMEELLEYLNRPDNLQINYFGYKLLQKIYNTLPKELCVKYPYPFLHIARNFILSGEKKAAIQGAEIMKIVQEYFEKHLEVPESFRNTMLGEIQVLNIFLVFNDAKKMVMYSRKAYELFNGGISSVICHNNEFTFGIPHFLYTYYKEAGKLQETINYIMEGFPPTVFGGCGTGCEYVALAEHALETGNMKSAKQFAEKAIYKAQTKMQICIILCANFTLMRCCLFQGEINEAKNLLLQSKEMLVKFRGKMSAQSNAIYNNTIALCEGYIYGCLKMPEMIPKWLRTGDMSSGIFMYQGLAFQCIIHGKAVLLSENWVKLEVLCESFKESYEAFHNQLGILHNSVYEAIAKAKLYGMKKGISLLLTALREAKKDGIILPFAENADFILPMLYELRGKNQLGDDYLEQLIKICQQYSENIEETMNNIPILTKREEEVLVLLAQGLTQQKIAKQLSVSVSSVKRHLESIYPKLGANNKITAIKNAEKLNILSSDS
jgi:LuxR family maltose regulon positive regulatory protein